MKSQTSNINGNIAWLFEKIKKVDEQIDRFQGKDELMTLQFKYQRNEFLKELNDYLATQNYNLEVHFTQ